MDSIECFLPDGESAQNGETAQNEERGMMAAEASTSGTSSSGARAHKEQ